MTDPTAADDRAPADYAESVAIPVDDPASLPDEVAALLPDTDWWLTRPEGSRLVGLVVARDDLPSVFTQRDMLTRFGVPIEGFRHPAPETGESWSERLHRLFGRLVGGDVLVIADKRALGRSLDEETRTFAELSRRGVLVKVLAHERR